MRGETEDLYRHFDAEGVLLYVGRSISAVARLGAHKREAGWWDDIATVTIEKVPQHAIRNAELVAIRDENPIHNIQRTPPMGAQFTDPATDDRRVDDLETITIIKAARYLKMSVDGVQALIDEGKVRRAEGCGFPSIVLDDLAWLLKERAA